MVTCFWKKRTYQAACGARHFRPSYVWRPPYPNPAMAASSRGPALLAAAEHGDEAALQRLLERARRPAQLLKTTDEQGCTALHLAADGHEGCVRLCLKAGADVSVADEGGYTPLSIACFYGHHECGRVLLEAWTGEQLQACHSAFDGSRT